MIASCSYEGCTVAETGQCALERDPTNCANRRGNLSDSLLSSEDAKLVTQEDIASPVLKSPEENPTFPSSLTLGISRIQEMMCKRYVTVVGILGDPESGKTACLTSLYLLVSNAMLEEWDFADSQSLMAFEAMARGARSWNAGKPPEQMTVHTELADERSPGFLHLRLRHKQQGRIIDLALPDLPGEWTKDLVHSSQNNRFVFLSAVDIIWLVVDGRDLENRERRHSVIARLGQLVGRLSSMLNSEMPRILIVVTHRDKYEPDPTIITRIHGELAKHNVSAELLAVAPFSENNDVKAGFGLEMLVNKTVQQNAATPEFWPLSSPSSNSSSFLSFRREL